MFFFGKGRRCGVFLLTQRTQDDVKMMEISLRHGCMDPQNIASPVLLRNADDLELEPSSQLWSDSSLIRPLVIGSPTYLLAIALTTESAVSYVMVSHSSACFCRFQINSKSNDFGV